MGTVDGKAAGPIAGTTFTDDCRTLASLSERVDELEKELKAVKSQRRALQFRLAEEFAESGLSSARVDDRTFYLRSDRFVRKDPEFSQEDAVALLRRAGLEDFVAETYSPARLKSYVKERHNEMEPGTPLEEALPPELRQAFKTYEETLVYSRNSK